MRNGWGMWRLCLGLGGLVLGGCSSMTGAPVAPSVSQPPGQWAMQTLPGKRQTLYTAAVRQGQRCTHAHADRSASLWRKKLSVPADHWQTVQFSWWVPAVYPSMTVADTERDDAVARVVLAFDGDRSRLSSRNRLMFELAQTLTGEVPPYATLMYVWDAQAPVGSVIINGRSDRVRKIVVESGATHTGDWRHYERDVRADFQLAFGEPAGPLVGLAYMTDGDNTASTVEACYGPAELR